MAVECLCVPAHPCAVTHRTSVRLCQQAESLSVLQLTVLGHQTSCQTGQQNCKHKLTTLNDYATTHSNV